MCYTVVLLHYFESVTMTQPTFDILEIDPRSRVLRRVATDDGAALDNPPPHPRCTTDGQHLIMTGSTDQPRFHVANALVYGLMQDGSFFTPLPEPVPDPLHFASPTERVFLLEYAAGATVPELITKYRKDVAIAMLKIAADNGFTIGNAQSVGMLIADARAEYTRSKMEADSTLQRQLAQGLHIGVRERDEEPAAPAYGVIYTPPPAVYDRAERRAGVYTPVSARMKWPFSDMGVGQAVTIDPKLAKRAQTTVHVYANRVGKRFTTRTLTKDGSLEVTRLADPVKSGF